MDVHRPFSSFNGVFLLIERLWRDVYEGVVGFYHGFFNHLESVGMLDPNDDLHILCLHTEFFPRINRHLNTWKKLG